MKPLYEFLVNNHVNALPKDCVDLGLSVLWCTHNVGAEVEMQMGKIFCYGDTEGDNDDYFSIKGYRYSGINMSLETLTENEDAAYKDNPKFRIPTRDEVEELLTLKHKIEETTNGLKGIRFFAKNSNGDLAQSIYFPFTGVKTRNVTRWFNDYTAIATTDGKRSNSKRYVIGLNSDNEVEPKWVSKYEGFPIRAVYNK